MRLKLCNITIAIWYRNVIVNLYIDTQEILQVTYLKLDLDTLKNI